MAGKTRKFITKRIKLTKTGKLVRRHTGQNHFLSKHSGKMKRRLHGKELLSEREKKAIVAQLKY
ncbi:MAG: 50S ribosomal protein L35 [bacterium]|nr:50S ribosomal protein L35 [bacterium]MDZ4296400.1 50S ribosomal protein L35 [Patescibacteria group bacterium]